jgi:hypothetical protein
MNGLREVPGLKPRRPHEDGSNRAMNDHANQSLLCILSPKLASRDATNTIQCQLSSVSASRSQSRGCRFRVPLVETAMYI